MPAVKLTDEQKDIILRFAKFIKSKDLKTTKAYLAHKEVMSEDMMFDVMVLVMSEILGLTEGRVRSEVKKAFNSLIAEENKQLFTVFGFSDEKKKKKNNKEIEPQTIGFNNISENKEV